MMLLLFDIIFVMCVCVRLLVSPSRPALMHKRVRGRVCERESHIVRAKRKKIRYDFAHRLITSHCFACTHIQKNKRTDKRKRKWDWMVLLYVEQYRRTVAVQRSCTCDFSFRYFISLEPYQNNTIPSSMRIIIPINPFWSAMCDTEQRR